MPSLIWFEWEKCVDGYSIETFRSDYVRFELERFGVNDELWRLTAYPNDAAPPWVIALFYDPHDNLFANEIQFSGQEEGQALVSHLNQPRESERYIVPRSDKRVRFKPFEGGAAAFMELADCVDSEPNIARFVSMYGYPSPDEDIYDMPFKWTGIVPVDWFVEKADEMRGGVRLWEEAQGTGDYRKVETLFNSGLLLGKDDEIEDFEPTDWQPGPVPRNEEDWMPQLVKLGVTLWRPRGSEGPPVLSLVPEDLEAALWLQLAQAITSNVNLRRCSVCPTWFPYGTGTGRRKSAHYCSDKCRKAAHRQRKANG